MTSIKKSVVIPLEKYNRLVSRTDAPEETPLRKEVPREVPLPREEVPLPREEAPLPRDRDESKWLLGIPSRFKRNVLAILDHFRGHTEVLTWNERGEIRYKGRVIPGSNVADLLKDSQRRYKSLDPYGEREFYRAWAELNIPEGLLGNDERKTRVRYYKKFPGDRYIPPPPGVPRKKPVQEWLRL